MNKYTRLYLNYTKCGPFFNDYMGEFLVSIYSLLSPGTFPNSDGNTGAFFRAENYRREFCVPKTGGLNVEVFALRVTFSEGTYQVKRGLWRNNFHYCFVHLYSCVHL